MTQKQISGIPVIDAAPIAAIEAAEDGSVGIVFYRIREDVGNAEKVCGIIRFDDFQSLNNFICLQSKLVGIIRQKLLAQMSAAGAGH